jgi:glucuronate isomerase
MIENEIIDLLSNKIKTLTATKLAHWTEGSMDRYFEVEKEIIETQIALDKLVG